MQSNFLQHHKNELWDDAIPENLGDCRRKKRHPKINSFLALHFRTLQASKKGNFVWNNFLDEKAIMPPES